MLDIELSQDELAEITAFLKDSVKKEQQSIDEFYNDLKTEYIEIESRLEQRLTSEKKKIASKIDTSTGGTPLHKACFDLDIARVAELLSQGANINGKNQGGFTPVAMLRHLTKYKNTITGVGANELILYLRRHGAVIPENTGTGIYFWNVCLTEAEYIKSRNKIYSEISIHGGMPSNLSDFFDKSKRDWEEAVKRSLELFKKYPVAIAKGPTVINHKAAKALPEQTYSVELLAKAKSKISLKPKASKSVPAKITLPIKKDKSRSAQILTHENGDIITINKLIAANTAKREVLGKRVDKIEARVKSFQADLVEHSTKTTELQQSATDVLERAKKLYLQSVKDHVIEVSKLRKIYRNETLNIFKVYQNSMIEFVVMNFAHLNRLYPESGPLIPSANMYDPYHTVRAHNQAICAARYKLYKAREEYKLRARALDANTRKNQKNYSNKKKAMMRDMLEWNKRNEVNQALSCFDTKHMPSTKCLSVFIQAVFNKVSSSAPVTSASQHIEPEIDYDAKFFVPVIQSVSSDFFAKQDSRKQEQSFQLRLNYSDKFRDKIQALHNFDLVAKAEHNNQSLSEFFAIDSTYAATTAKLRALEPQLATAQKELDRVRPKYLKRCEQLSGQDLSPIDWIRYMGGALSHITKAQSKVDNLEQEIFDSIKTLGYTPSFYEKVVVGAGHGAQNIFQYESQKVMSVLEAFGFLEEGSLDKFNARLDSEREYYSSTYIAKTKTAKVASIVAEVVAQQSIDYVVDKVVLGKASKAMRNDVEKLRSF